MLSLPLHLLGTHYQAIQFSGKTNDVSLSEGYFDDSPQLYELEERSRPDEMAMINRGGEIAREFLDNNPHSNVLELCSGTGLSARHVLGFPEDGLEPHRNAETYTAIDISPSFLKFAKERYEPRQVSIPAQMRFIEGDAVDAVRLVDGRKFNLIMGASAYHHIDDARKVEFLRGVNTLLAPNGRVILMENILPPYKNASSKKTVTKTFYREVLNTAKMLNPRLPRKVADLITSIATMGNDGKYEYKVHLEIFKRHLKEAGLEIERTDKVWPTDPVQQSTLKTGGNYVFVIKKAKPPSR